MLLRMTSKRVQEVVDSLRPSDVVKVRKPLRVDVHHGTDAEQLQRILRQLEKMTCQFRITRLDLSICNISGQQMQRGLQGCCHSALVFLSFTLVTMRSVLREQGSLQEFCHGT